MSTNLRTEMDHKKPKILVSACLIGSKVRYDGGHLTHKWVNNELSEIVDFIPVCPEVISGLGSSDSPKREPIRQVSLKQKNEEGEITETIHILGTNSKKDYTQMMKTGCHQILSQLGEIDGFIGAGKSPSCGPERIKVYQEGAKTGDKKGVGVFVSSFKEKFPGLPLIDSGRLHETGERDLFLRQIISHQRLRTMQKTVSELQLFHQHNKYMLMEFDPLKLKELGRICAHSDNKSIEDLFDEYKKVFFETLSLRPSKKKRINVLYHVIGYFKKQLGDVERKEFEEALTDYQKDLVPYIVPLRLLKLFTEKYDNQYLRTQTFMNPYPLHLAPFKDVGK